MSQSVHIIAHQGQQDFQTDESHGHFSVPILAAFADASDTDIPFQGDLCFKWPLQALEPSPQASSALSIPPILSRLQAARSQIQICSPIYSPAFNLCI